MTGLPKIGIMGLGISLVRGRTRVPWPAARIMPLSGIVMEYFLSDVRIHGG